MEGELAKEINNRRFIPYLQIHEYEGLLFSDPAAIASVLTVPGSPAFMKLEARLSAIRNRFTTPEEINDEPATHPAQRIAELVGSYQKVLHGSRIAERITINDIRAQCMHFNEWLERLEGLAP